jgi:hypothetical protein
MSRVLVVDDDADIRERPSPARLSMRKFSRVHPVGSRISSRL